MKILCLLTVLVLGCSSGWANKTTHKDEPVVLDYVDHISHFVNARNPTTDNGDHWRKARQYIKNKFVQNSLTLKTQIYTTDVVNLTDTEIEVTGENIIGIAESESKSNKDKVIVVAADYDTRQAPDNPINNNGVGVAALIEIAKAYNERIRTDDFHANYTVIFVAFDLNTKKHYPTKGKQGSHVFVTEWLMNYLKNDTSRFRGAIILDQISNINMNNQTQELFEGTNKYLPAAYKRITEDGLKGNFIGMYKHWNQSESEIAFHFSANYNKKKMSLPFRLQELALKPPIRGDPTWVSVEKKIMETSQYPFWAKSLPAILITDTGSNRVDACEGRCKPKQFVTMERKPFIDATAKSVVDTLLLLQTTHMRVNDGDGAASMSPSFLYSLVILVGVLLLR